MKIKYRLPLLGELQQGVADESISQALTFPAIFFQELD